MKTLDFKSCQFDHDQYKMKSPKAPKSDVSLFCEIWGPQRLPCDHKIRCKLPLGQKQHQMAFTIIQEEDCLKEDFQD